MIGFRLESLMGLALEPRSGIPAIRYSSGVAASARPSVEVVAIFGAPAEPANGIEFQSEPWC